jgi:hypothetical protein
VNPNPYEYCPVYLSLLNQSNTLIADGAGTIATYGDTEVFRWTFQTAGTYYMVMESNGDMPAGDPTYAVSYRVTSGSQSSPLIRSLHVARHQLGTSVTARVDLGQPAALIRALLVSERGKTIAVDTRHALGVGRERLTLELPASYRRVLKDRHRLRLTVKLKVAGASGHASFSRPITLTG